MSKEKQIEEMAIIISHSIQKWANDLPPISCPVYNAENLYAAGYRKQSEWISVEERLPEENGRYLVCVNVSHLAFTNLTIIAVMEYGKKHGFYLYSEDEPVTHWMPLPEAPKMKGGAE